MMKGEYREEEDEFCHNQNQNQNQNPTNSTPQNDTSTQNTFQNHPKFLSPPPHFHYQTTPLTKKPKNTPSTSSEETGTIELSRRPRGRPPGSKNKPKPAIVITRSPDDPGMSPYILELPSGSDIVTSLTRFTRKRGLGLCVLTATGAVLNVTLNQPSTTSSSSSSSSSVGSVMFRGRFDILSISACLTNHFNGGFSISLAGPHGQIVGGKVVGPLVCDGTVFVVASSFDNPTFCRLPLQDPNKNNNNNYNGDVEAITGGGGGGGVESSSPISEGGGGGHMSLYMGNSSNDVMWGNTSSAANVRPLPPPY